MAHRRAMPRFVKASSVPLSIVCGPPGSGKSTFAREKSKSGETIIDLDEIIADISGLPLYQADKQRWLAGALRQRNLMLERLHGNPGCSAAWFIVGAPNASEREEWNARLRPDAIYILLVPEQVCIERIRSDRRRRGAPNIGEMIAAVGKWWDAYQPRPGDIEMRES
jgi:5-methylcytosine-specific restriction protein A